ncbi:hypothetical protein W911_03805 [Hyphomicrobium nitrativorans NL23]|uniref:Uncharacterized protein n=1 Tax=Hyphomicrobium nitrativorans NL23 TaxID=1029756 RepID=V5SHA2_9HYPH|nr:hypothetical protein [Hyphomicrobium nitrativorans]AHB49913.1 hypothetical protein W911_03805 [Hyphomicrobium nitrativorans NL23]
MTSSNPFWFEDLVFLVMEESRRLPERASAAFSRARRTAEAGAAAVVRMKPLLVREAVAPAKAVPVATVQTRVVARVEADLLDDPLSWALATEPLVSGAKGVERAVELHEKAREQLGAITYVLDRMRDELSPALSKAPARTEQKPADGDAAVRLDTSIEALLALSRRNAATRPKDRLLTAA